MHTAPFKQKAACLAAFLLFLLMLYLQFYAGDAGDKNWLIYATRKWLSGGKLYVDVFDLNSPILLWMYALPVFASLKLGISAKFTCVVTSPLRVLLLVYGPTALIRLQL